MPTYTIDEDDTDNNNRLQLIRNGAPHGLFFFLESAELPDPWSDVYCYCNNSQIDCQHMASLPKGELKIPKAGHFWTLDQKPLLTLASHTEPKDCGKSR